MNRMRSVACVLTGMLSALAPACADVSPLPYSEADTGTGAPDAAVADAGLSDALAAECRQCLTAGPCASLQTACVANTKCATFADCMMATFCWGSSFTDLTRLSPCIVQCGVASGITSQADPGALLVAPLLLCAQDPNMCGSVCDPGGDR